MCDLNETFPLALGFDPYNSATTNDRWLRAMEKRNATQKERPDTWVPVFAIFAPTRRILPSPSYGTFEQTP